MVNGRIYIWPRVWLAIDSRAIDGKTGTATQQINLILGKQFGLQGHRDNLSNLICVDLTHEQIRLGSPETTARKILKALNQLGAGNKKSQNKSVRRNISYSLGLGVNRLYATYAARRGRPSGLEVFPHWRIRKEAATLKLHDLLLLDSRLLDALVRDGIQTVAHALGAGEGKLRRYLGNNGHAVYRSLQGEEVTAGMAGASLVADQLYFERILPANTCSRAAARRYVRQLLQQAVRNLRTREQFARAMYYEIHPGGGMAPLRGVRCLDAAVPDVELLVKVLTTRIEKAGIGRYGIMRLVVMFSGIGNLSGQGDLLTENLPLVSRGTYAGGVVSVEEKYKRALFPAVSDTPRKATYSFARAS